jgi:hypothetical protein
MSDPQNLKRLANFFVEMLLRLMWVALLMAGMLLLFPEGLLILSFPVLYTSVTTAGRGCIGLIGCQRANLVSNLCRAIATVQEDCRSMKTCKFRHFAGQPKRRAS